MHTRSASEIHPPLEHFASNLRPLQRASPSSAYPPPTVMLVPSRSHDQRSQVTGDVVYLRGYLSGSSSSSFTPSNHPWKSAFLRSDSPSITRLPSKPIHWHTTTSNQSIPSHPVPSHFTPHSSCIPIPPPIDPVTQQHSRAQ
ncbi:hypothetical protein K505DRAFT_76303 [Melanomma pulvis-pyrius CBS 109.77]|uniref:Uncharacterized protein n=1 Tax=Melanomma pulvis-pyrius CBS 109.77 TaxID=1314802 RepID=A0A6A6X330_9PLEO|nr:hypothetical protein K505DRAFT_76303 [Melanomma pulvis-pyrius CBS 109.77]